MPEVVAKPARRSRMRFIRRSLTVNAAEPITQKGWPRRTDMFDALFSESQSRIDKLQIAAICILMLVGTAFVYSATMVTETANSAPWYNQIWVRQLFWYVVGLGAATAVCLINYHTLARWALVLYWGNILLLALVLAVGTVRFGARRWFDLGFFSLQPSEFAK